MALQSYMTKRKYKFASAKALESLIAQYFEPEGNEPPTEPKGKTAVEFPTIAGLALFLGFNSRQEFEDYEAAGGFGKRLKRAKLRIEELYEKRLHTQYTSGAIYALKNLNGNERLDNKLSDEPVNVTLKVEIVESGPALASSEKEVIL
jgi:hypothetical protein